ncbi:MAG TPA: carbohydrate binding family 9 domain-containing protein, partial [Flavisolibacter sp.]|nr:carbohydrate binding family 9 domain-containing protein [Flavisolibacter sp.]
MRSILLLLIFITGGATLFGQKRNISFQLNIHRTRVPVIIDGIQNDLAWQNAEPATDFFMVLPMDTSKASLQTEVKMAYDDHNIYLLATCFAKGTDMVESLRRDFSFTKNDNFLLFIDPFQDGTNGFSFGANAAGAQWDGLMYEGGKVDLSW